MKTKKNFDVCIIVIARFFEIYALKLHFIICGNIDLTGVRVSKNSCLEKIHKKIIEYFKKGTIKYFLYSKQTGKWAN